MRCLLLLLAATVVLPTTGCSGDSDDPYVGLMADHSYGAQLSDGDCLQRPDANGNPTCVDRFAGRFVWADYAAPWCAPCTVQARTLRKLEEELGDEIVFLTVMTSVTTGYQSVPTAETARDWSRQFGLDPSHVVAADNLWGMPIPTHILYSPKGQTLYRSSGYLTGSTIREIIRERTDDWHEHERTGRRTKWMR